LQIVLFSKMFDRLPTGELADLAKELGFDGVDLTVRPGGHIEPEEVEGRLPEAVEALEARGLSLPMITTAITDPEEPHAESTFRAASNCGVRLLKLGYWPYRGLGTLLPDIEAVREKLRGIARLAEKYGVCATVHVHSGDFLTADPIAVYLLLRDLDPDLVGAYIDPGHMALEGGISGWKMGIDALSDRIRIVAVKDFAWVKTRDVGGNVKWTFEHAPLREGIVPWDEVFSLLNRLGFDGVVSLHNEYPGKSHEELVEMAREDLAYLREVVRRACGPERRGVEGEG